MNSNAPERVLQEVLPVCTLEVQKAGLAEIEKLFGRVAVCAFNQNTHSFKTTGLHQKMAFTSLGTSCR